MRHARHDQFPYHPCNASRPCPAKIYQAVSAANESVFRFAGGKGGATLSAVVLGGGGAAFVAHVGDSRVYSFGPNMRVERLTKDDSLAEAVGGHGRELLQFIGMGPEMQPFISEIPSGSKISRSRATAYIISKH